MWLVDLCSPAKDKRYNLYLWTMNDVLRDSKLAEAVVKNSELPSNFIALKTYIGHLTSNSTRNITLLNQTTVAFNWVCWLHLSVF